MSDPRGAQVRTVAIFGGSFNPPHLGHQALCLMVLEACEVDALWVVPTYRHHFGKELVDYRHRVALCRRMVAPLGERAEVSEVEGELALPTSRMLDTLLELQARHADTQFRLVIGADILDEVEHWYRWPEVAALAPPLVFQRHGYKGGELPAPPDVSSTAIRMRLAQGKSAVPLVPRDVQRYIDDEGLYR